MSTAKNQIKKMLDEIPDDASLEDIQYHIYVQEKVERGLKDIEQGKTVPQQAIEQRMARWLGK